MKPTNDWIKVFIAIIRIILVIPWVATVVLLRILGCIAWFLSLGHLKNNAFIPAEFIETMGLTYQAKE